MSPTRTTSRSAADSTVSSTVTATAGAAANSTRPRPAEGCGTVAFVGAGPGSPDLLTVRAAELIRDADVIVGDLGRFEAVLAAHAGPDAERVDTESEALTSTEAARLVVRQAREGRSVVRLLSGDPFLASASADHVAAVAKARVPFEVVPGVSAATGVPAYAGIPLTSEKIREVCVLDVAEPVDWSAYTGTATLVVFSAEDRIEEVASGLMAAGRSPKTPVAITCNGTTTEQRTVASTLDRIAVEAAAEGIAGPAVTVVGETVDLRETLSWFETKPLFGWRVLVPRTKEQAGALSAQLRAYGAVPEEVPTIAVEPPRTPQQMERAIKGLVTGRYEWIAFTSTNAVRAVRERFEQYGLDARAFAGIKIAVVGEQTALALQAWGIKPDLVPSGEQSSDGLLADWPPYDNVFDPINRVFLPRADIATETLVAGLVGLGWEVDDVTAYRTVRAAPPPAPVREAIKGGGFDAVLFTSSSTVRNLVGIAGKPHANTIVACIGPQTAKTAEEHGLRVDVLAPQPSVAVLAAALAEYGMARRLAAIEAGEPVTRPSEKRSAARRKAR